MTNKCRDCGVIYTNKSGAPKVDPARVPMSKCGDCVSYDWPVWNAKVAKAREWMGDPNKKKAATKGQGK